MARVVAVREVVVADAVVDTVGAAAVGGRDAADEGAQGRARRRAHEHVGAEVAVVSELAVVADGGDDNARWRRELVTRVGIGELPGTATAHCRPPKNVNHSAVRRCLEYPHSCLDVGETPFELRSCGSSPNGVG